MNRTIRFVLAACILEVSASTWAGSLRAIKVWETEAKFKQPESVVYDAKRDVLYVSNVDGDSMAKDGKGFISRLALNGDVSSTVSHTFQLMSEYAPQLRGISLRIVLKVVVEKNMHLSGMSRQSLNR